MQFLGGIVGGDPASAYLGSQLKGQALEEGQQDIALKKQKITEGAAGIASDPLITRTPGLSDYISNALRSSMVPGATPLTQSPMYGGGGMRSSGDIIPSDPSQPPPGVEYGPAADPRNPDLSQMVDPVEQQRQRGLQALAQAIQTQQQQAMAFQPAAGPPQVPGPMQATPPGPGAQSVPLQTTPPGVASQPQSQTPPGGPPGAAGPVMLGGGVTGRGVQAPPGTPQPQMAPPRPQQPTAAFQQPGPQMVRQPPQAAVRPSQPQQQAPQRQPSDFVNPMQVMKMISEANPGASPAAIIKATEKVMGLVNQGALAQYRMQPHGRMAGYTPAEENIAKDIAQEISDGRQSPSLKGLYRMQPLVRDEAAKMGLNLMQLQLQEQRAQRQIASLNAPRMQLFVSTAATVKNAIEEVRNLSRQMDLSGVQFLNWAEIESAMRLRGNTPEGKLATQYVTAINTLRERFANYANNGFAPTESVWRLANKQLNENFGRDQMAASLDEIGRLVNFQLNSVPNLGTLGPGAVNPYIPGSGQAPAAPGASAPAGGQQADPLGIR